MLSIISCGIKPVQVKTIIPDRPIIQSNYEELLKKCPIDLQKEAIKHEWDWNFWADKLEERVK